MKFDNINSKQHNNEHVLQLEYQFKQANNNKKHAKNFAKFSVKASKHA